MNNYNVFFALQCQEELCCRCRFGGELLGLLSSSSAPFLAVICASAGAVSATAHLAYFLSLLPAFPLHLTGPILFPCLCVPAWRVCSFALSSFLLPLYGNSILWPCLNVRSLLLSAKANLWNVSSLCRCFFFCPRRSLVLCAPKASTTSKMPENASFSVFSQ